MYFPFLRGKRNEFWALEKVEKLILENEVIPIIELVDKTKNLKTLNDKELNMIIIVNPLVGELKENSSWIENEIINNLNNKENIIVAYQITSTSKKRDIKEFYRKWKNYSICFIHKEEIEYIDWFLDEYMKEDILNIVEIDYISNYYLENIKINSSKVVILSDGFDKKETNKDYLDWSKFTTYNYTYKNEGFYGYSDYLMIGRKYVEGGGPPHTIAIHYTYLKADEVIMKHFTSDNKIGADKRNEKIFEALVKLNKFIKMEEPYNTRGTKIFQELYENQHSTSLEKLKQYSIEHHIESITFSIKNA